MENRRQNIRIFVPLLLVVATLVIVLALVMSTLYQRETERQFAASYLSSLKLVSSLYEQRRLHAIPVIEQLFGNQDVQEYLFAQTSTPEQALRPLSTILDDYVLRNDYIHSIYLYNGEWGYYSTFDGYERQDCRSDPTLSDWIRQIGETPLSVGLRKVRFSHSFNNGDASLPEQDLYSLIISHRNENPDKAYALVVNLSESQARDMFTQNIPETEDGFYILEGDGVFLSHPDSSYFGTHVEEHSLFEQVFHLEGGEGYRILRDTGGKRYFVCWTDQGTMGWRLFYLMPMSRILAGYHGMNRSIILLVVLFLVISLIVLARLSRRLYRSLSYERRLARYLRGESLEEEEPVAGHHLYTFALVHMVPLHDRYRSFSIEERADFHDAMVKLMVRFLKRRPEHTLFVSLGAGEFAWICLSTPAVMKGRLQLLGDAVHDGFSCRLNAVVGSRELSFDSLPEWSRQMENQLQEQAVTGLSAVDFVREREPGEENAYDMQEMVGALKLKDGDAFQRAMKPLLRQIEGHPSVFGFDLLRITLEMSVRQYVKQEMDLYNPGGTAALIDALEEGDRTIEQLRLLCSDISLALLQASENRQGSKLSSLVEEANQYIGEHLDDANLNSAMVAEHLGLSLNYTRTLYKQVTGVSINEVIGSRRLEKAAGMLSSSDDSVNEIRLACGFLNYSYFCTYFKEKYGVSPSLYRKQRRISK